MLNYMSSLLTKFLSNIGCFFLLFIYILIVVGVSIIIKNLIEAVFGVSNIDKMNSFFLEILPYICIAYIQYKTDKRIADLEKRVKYDGFNWGSRVPSLDELQKKTEQLYLQLERLEKSLFRLKSRLDHPGNHC